MSNNLKFFSKGNKNFSEKKKSYRKQYRNENRQQAVNNSFKFITGAVLISLLFIIVISIVSIVVLGLNPIFNSEYSDIIDFSYLLFGSSYQIQADMIAVGYMFVNTVITSILALLIATPFSVATAIVVTKMAPKWLSSLMNFSVVALSAVPSVIFGLFASYVVNGAVTSIFPFVQGGTNLSAIITLAMMITPTITLVSINSINSVNKSLADASLALGATKTQTNIKVTLRSAAPGIFAGMILGIGRALGEATAISLVADPINSGPTFAFLEPTQTLTTTMLQGFSEVDPGTMEYSLRFTMALILLVTIVLVIASMNYIKKRKFDNSYKSKKIDYTLKSKQMLYTKVCNSGTDSLSFIEEMKFNRFYRQDSRNKLISSPFHDTNVVSETNTSKSKTADYIGKTNKKNDTDVDVIVKKSIKSSKIINSILYTLSGLSIAVLFSIIIFLVSMGASSLSWSFLSNPYYDLQYSVYAENDTSTYYYSDLEDNQMWSEDWGFGVEYNESESGEDYMSIFLVDDNSPLSKANIMTDSVTSVVDKDGLGESKDLSNINNLQLDFIFDEYGKLPDTSVSIYGWNNTYNWYDVENKDSLQDWINDQEYLTITTTENMRGISGSLANTLLLVGLTMLIAIPIGFSSSYYICNFIKSRKTKERINSTLSIFGGIPTLIVGLIGASLFIPLLPVEGYMWAAALTMTLIVLPSIIISVTNAIDNSSKSKRNGALALGATETKAFFSITLPEVFPVLVSTTVMSIGRVIGETAALIMVIGMVPVDVATMSGGATLSTHIYYLMKGTEIADYASAAAIALVIIGLISFLFAISKSIESKRKFDTAFYSIVFIMIIVSILTSVFWLFWLLLSTMFAYWIFNFVTFVAKTKYNIDIKQKVLSALKLKGKENV